MKKRNVFAAPVLVLAVVLAACGSVGPSKAELERQQQERQQQERQEQERLERRKQERERQEAAQKAGAERQRLEAKPVTEDDFEIQQNSKGTITITRYTGQATRITIPATISGIAVTEIDSDVFSGNKRIISAVLPEWITDLPGWHLSRTDYNDDYSDDHREDGFFTGCSSLQSVQLPSTLKTIGNGAFAGCALTSLTLPNGLKEIGADAFVGVKLYDYRKVRFDYDANKNKIQTLVIPDSVTSIGGDAFRNCGIETLSIGNGLTTIYSGAFAGNRIKDLAIPDSVIHINPSAFSNCGIQTLKLGKGITSIENGAFAHNQIAELTIPASVKTIGKSAFIGNRITALVIPNGVTVLGEGSFRGNPITSLTILSPSLSFDGAFDSFTSITLPADVDPRNLRAFGDLENFYTSQGKKAGTYVKNGRIWTV
jgi:hypothetical protein